MGLTYGGVPLTAGLLDRESRPIPTAEIPDRLGITLDPWRVHEFTHRCQPGPNLVRLTQESWSVPRAVTLGTLFWPVGASRWAEGHFLASERQVQQLRPLAYAGTTKAPVALDLVMSSRADRSFTTKLYSLPPRPLTQFLTSTGGAIAGLNGYYVLTLVDERFFWWQKNTGKYSFAASDSWASVLTSLASQLGVSITQDAVSSNYQKPSADAPLIANYEALPLLLDAVAYNCGQRIVRRLNGTVECISLATSEARVTANLAAALPKKAGGKFNQTTDMAGALPSKVTVMFPLWEDGVPKYQVLAVRPDDPDLYTVDVQLSSIARYAALAGSSGAKVFHDTAHATLNAGGVTPTNATALSSLATQIATDFYGHIASALLDTVYNGVANWLAEGLHDVEYAYRLEDVSTRVMRREWNLDPEELMHADGTGAPILPVGALGQQVMPFTTQLLTVTSSTPVDTNLYPATLSYYTRNSVTPNTSAACFILSAAGTALNSGDVCEAIPNGRLTSGSNKPLYICTGQAAALTPDRVLGSCYITVSATAGHTVTVLWQGFKVTGSGTTANVVREIFSDAFTVSSGTDSTCTDSGATYNNVTIDVNNTGASFKHNLLSATHPDTTAHSPGVGSLVVGNSGGTSWIYFAGNSGTLRYLTEDSGGSPQWLPSMVYAIDSSFGCTTSGSLFSETMKGPQPKIALAGSCYITCQVAETAGTNTDNDPANWGKLTFSVYWCGFQVSDGSGVLTTHVDRLDFGTDFKLTPSTDGSCTTDDGVAGAHKKIAVALDNCGLAGSPVEGDDTSDMCDVTVTAVLNSDCTITVTVTKKYRRKTYCHGRLWTVGSCLVSP